MSTQVTQQGVAETRNDKGRSTQSPTTTQQETLLRKDTVCSVPELKKGQKLTFDYGDIQFTCDTLGMSYREQVSMVRTNDPSGSAARGINAANSRLAALLIKKKDIQLVPAPMEDFTKLVGNMTPPATQPPPNLCPSGIAQLPQALKKWASYFSTEGQAAEAYKIKKTPLIAQQKIAAHNLQILKQLSAIFDEATATAKWGLQLASKTTMWTYQSKDESATREDFLQAFIETDPQRTAHSRMV